MQGEIFSYLNSELVLKSRFLVDLEGKVNLLFFIALKPRVE